MKKDQPSLKLKYSKVIRPRTRKTFESVEDKETGRLITKEIGLESREYRELRETRSDIRGVITPRKIQMYRWWFRWLQLSLELEELGVTLYEHRRVSSTSTKKGYFKKFSHKVKVNRSKYEGWDLDEIKTTNFDKWWRTHSHLFVETPTHVTEIKNGKEVVGDEFYRYFRVDTRMRTNDIVSSLRKQLEKNRRRTEFTTKWVVTGELRQEKLFNCYNGMVMWLQGKTPKEILESNLFRKSRGQETKHIEDLGRGGRSKGFHRKGLVTKRTSKESLDRLRDIIVPSKQLILTVCDGYFCKHGRNKKYFGR